MSGAIAASTHLGPSQTRGIGDPKPAVAAMLRHLALGHGPQGPMNHSLGLIGSLAVGRTGIDNHEGDSAWLSLAGKGSCIPEAGDFSSGESSEACINCQQWYLRAQKKMQRRMPSCQILAMYVSFLEGSQRPTQVIIDRYRQPGISGAVAFETRPLQ